MREWFKIRFSQVFVLLILLFKFAFVSVTRYYFCYSTLAESYWLEFPTIPSLALILFTNMIPQNIITNSNLTVTIAILILNSNIEHQSGRCVQIEIFQFTCRREFDLNYNERAGG